MRWAQVDFTTRSALFLKTKTGTHSMRYLTEELTKGLAELAAAAGANDRVFRFTDRPSVNERIKAESGRAGIRYKSSHVCGRHAFTTNAMEAGLDIRTAMAGWRREKLVDFLETYVHPRTNSDPIVSDRSTSTNTIARCDQVRSAERAASRGPFHVGQTPIRSKKRAIRLARVIAGVVVSPDADTNIGEYGPPVVLFQAGKIPTL